MSMSNAFEDDVLRHIFHNLAIANLGDASGLQPSAVAGNLYVALHTADPGEGGDQSTNEATFTSYARVGVIRSAAGWTLANPAITNAALIAFAECTGGTNTITHVSIGVASAGATRLIVSAALAVSRAVSNGVTVQFAIGQLTVTAD